MYFVVLGKPFQFLAIAATRLKQLKKLHVSSVLPTHFK